MKHSKTISIEEKYGKYLFDKKIKTKNIISKQVIIKAKEEIDLGEKKINYKINEINDDLEEKKKIIQIIQSFEDPSENISLENLSFISQDSQFTIQLKEELPKTRNNESIKSDFLCSPFLNPDSIKNDINNIIDLKKNIFMEPLLNNSKYASFKKSIKIIKNEIFEKSGDETDADNTKDINHKDENDKENNNNDEDKKDEDEDENDLYVKKKKVILKSLIYFNRDGVIDGIENFKKRLPDFNKSKFEEDNKFEKNVYLRIEDRIREILNKCKSDKLSQLREFENISVLIYHFDKISCEFFLINHSKAWVISTLASFAEMIIGTYYFNEYKKIKILFFIGLILTIIGQYFRIAALFTGKKNFTHRIRYKKVEQHELIMNGIYSLSRHPSYFGFFIWSVGIEIMCCNPICTIAFTVYYLNFLKIEF